MARLKVGFVTPALYWGGAERWMLDLARFSGHALEWVGVASVSPMNRDDTMVSLFSELMPVEEHGRNACRRVAQRADVLVAWGSYSLHRMIAGFTGPVVFTGHGQGQFDCNAAMASVRGATHWAAVAEAATPPIMEAGVPHDQIAVLHNGIDPGRCKKTRTRAEVRAELGVTPDQFLVGYVGRMVPEKNPRGVAEAVAMSPRNFRAVFVGGGWDRARQVAACRGVLGKRAIFVDRIEDVGNYYRALDCFAQASPAEGFSMGMLEAMLCRVPCALTNVGVLPELEAKHGRHWESVEPGTLQTSEELGYAIQRIAAMPIVDQFAMATEARRIVDGNYLAEHMAARWIGHLERIHADWQPAAPRRARLRQVA
ncbi:MAG: glycosyltransferase [Opitutae bacterium]|nr:glycosyltransferase [Opitutae bacterium]